MLKQTKEQQEKGFTIIEVLIVLAIAGLILLIVLLAVPALQRNQRNTARKQDVSRVAGAVTNFVSNNGGTLPSSTTDLTTIINDTGKLGQYPYASSDVSAVVAVNKMSIDTSGSAVAVISGSDEINVVTKQICDTANAGKTTPTGATSRSIALQYTLETGNNTYAGYCQNAN